jgi:3-oxo-5alpha-steroid 4-dehydrogenase
VPPDWDVEADVVVVGFGAAGACAALEAAAAGCSVLILDRFGGGGATALSGGVVYAGGGTPQQRAAGVTDTPEAMLGYLRTEVGDAVPEATLREFCDGSVAMLAWLEGHGVPFEGSLCPDKTSYPTNRHYLYYSGSELSAAAPGAATPPGAGAPGAAAWPPAPRGHRTRARGTSGGLLYARLAAAVRGAGRVLHRPVAWLERRYARPLRIGAARGVILAAGGFAANRAMMRAHAPNARGGLPLATPGDDGSGIGLGTQAGGATAFLDRVSVWRFLSPPPALLAGVLVDRAGQRVCDESRYGAALGDAIIRHGGRAWLLIDHATRAQARRQVRGSTLWFQRLQAWYLLSLGAVRAPTVAAVAARAGVDPDGLAATLATYNTASRHPAAPDLTLPDLAAPDLAAPDPAAPDLAAPDPAAPDPAGKPAAARRPQDQPPFYLIDVSVRPRLFYPAPVLTLGGLAVAPGSGQVLRPDGRPVDGLYAAGRTAAGLCSRSYVSGLSLADCVFSGRRAGHHAATETITLRRT